MGRPSKEIRKISTQLGEDTRGWKRYYVTYIVKGTGEKEEMGRGLILNNPCHSTINKNVGIGGSWLYESWINHQSYINSWRIHDPN